MTSKTHSHRVNSPYSLSVYKNCTEARIFIRLAELKTGFNERIVKSRFASNAEYSIYLGQMYSSEYNDNLNIYLSTKFFVHYSKIFDFCKKRKKNYRNRSVENSVVNMLHTLPSTFDRFEYDSS